MNHIHEIELAEQDRAVILTCEPERLPFSDRLRLTTYCSEYNDRLSAINTGKALRRFGILPFPYPQETFSETKRILEEINLEGVCIIPGIDNRYPDEDDYTSLLELLASHNTPLLLHPFSSTSVTTLQEGSLNTVLAIARLFYFDRVRMLGSTELYIAHSTDAIPFLKENLGVLWYMQHKKKRMGKFLFDYLVRKRLAGEEFLERIHTI